MKSGKCRFCNESLEINFVNLGNTSLLNAFVKKENKLLNYCKINSELMEYTVDSSPHKQGLFLPETHIPIEYPQKIQEAKLDYVFILSWNLKDEIMNQLEYIKKWGGIFVIPIPVVKILS